MIRIGLLCHISSDDEFIGQVCFDPGDLYPTFPDTLNIKKHNIDATLHLNWE